VLSAAFARLRQAIRDRAISLADKANKNKNKTRKKEIKEKRKENSAFTFLRAEKRSSEIRKIRGASSRSGPLDRIKPRGTGIERHNALLFTFLISSCISPFISDFISAYKKEVSQHETGDENGHATRETRREKEKKRERERERERKGEGAMSASARAGWKSCGLKSRE